MYACMDGVELGASNLKGCVFADRRKNSPVDYFAGGSREATPASGTNKKDKQRKAFVFYFKQKKTG